MKKPEFSKKKNKKNYTFIIWAFLLATLPFIMCIVRIMVSGSSFAELWPSGSVWNDEAFYFKQTEGIVKYGLPQGFFGYNESSAELLSFGAWVPLIHYPLALFGKIFGFGPLTPYFFNIAFLTLSLLTFGLLSKIDLGGMSSAYLALFVFIPLSRFMFSYMPEIMIISFCIILLGLYQSSLEKPHFAKDILMYLILTYLVILRPYLAVLFLLPVMSAFKRKGKRKFLFIILSIICSGIALAAYSYISKKYTAPYFGDIYVDWLGKMRTHGPKTVLIEIGNSLSDNFNLLGLRMSRSISELDPVGGYYMIFIVMSGLLLLSAPIAFLFIRLQASEKEKKDFASYHKIFVYGLMFLGQLTVFFAILMLYNIEDGYRHLIVFVVLDILLLLSDANTFASFKFLSVGICVVLSLFYFLLKGDDPANYKLPTLDVDAPERTEFNLSAETLKNEMPLSEGISWKNTVDMCFVGKSKLSVYYIIPEGFGINLCSPEYMDENLTSLKSGYIAVPTDSDISSKALDAGYQKIADVTDGFTIYRNPILKKP